MQKCHRITCKNYDWKECVIGGLERLEEQYSAIIEFEKMYESESDGSNRRGKPLEGFKERVEECLGERY